MKTTSWSFILLFTSVVASVNAGPSPGTYNGTFTRVAPAAKPKLDSYPCSATAYNPSDPLATASTHVIFNATKSASESVRCKVILLPSGQLDFDLSGKVRSRTTGKLIRFKASGVGSAAIGATSLSSNINKGELRRNTPAKIDVTARSDSGNLFVTFSVRGSGPHPLGFYSGSFAGAIPAM